MKIKAVIFDIDGVVTDGKKYLLGDNEIKNISLKDLDAINMLKEQKYIIGAITGENNSFSQKLKEELKIDFLVAGCKQKKEAIEKISKEFFLSMEEICYIGDGKYDIDVLKEVGLSLCPADAIEEVKKISNFVLTRRGGEGCIAEIFSLLNKLKNNKNKEFNDDEKIYIERMKNHQNILSKLLNDDDFMKEVMYTVRLINNMYSNNGQLFLCGNGGSAADAQHIAAELVGRFYLERKALNAEALTVNSSIITSLANDYDYDMIFARQLEAKAKQGDVLIGITTSGKSKNILNAFIEAKKLGISTILMTGYIDGDIEIINYADYILSVPSLDTPRIQEMHILIGHIMCEIVEKNVINISGKEEK